MKDNKKKNDKAFSSQKVYVSILDFISLDEYIDLIVTLHFLFDANNQIYCPSFPVPHGQSFRIPVIIRSLSSPFHNMSRRLLLFSFYCFLFILMDFIRFRYSEASLGTFPFDFLIIQEIFSLKPHLCCFCFHFHLFIV